MTFVFKHIAWLDLAFNVGSLLLFFIYSDRFGYKLQMAGFLYLFIILGLVAGSALSALSTFLSARASIVLGCLLFVPSGINLLFALVCASEK